MFHKFYSKINIIKLIIFISLLISIIISKYNLITHDEFFLEIDEKKNIHKMIKYDTFRYLSHGAEIKRDLENNKNFFETGREHFTKYLPPRLAAAYYHFFDINLFNNFEEKKINLGVHFPYLLIQCLIYYLSLFFLYSVISKKIDPKICLPIIIFLSLEPTIFQYHSTFWSESIFFSLQLALLAIIIKNDFKFYNFLLIGIFLSLLSLQRQTAYFFIIFILIYYLIFLDKNQYYKLIYIILGFFLIQSFVGYNNYVRDNKFYLFTSDTKTAVYYNIVDDIIIKAENLSINDFKKLESDIAVNWLNENSLDYDKKIISDIENTRYPFKTARLALKLNSDKVKFDNFYATRTINILLEYPLTSIKIIAKRSLHSLLLNPFHIYSDHNFISGEKYYLSDQHQKLIPLRIIYTLFIYSISLLGIYVIFKEKSYQTLAIIIISILYNYGMVSWHGNTRYFVPTLIYLSFLFGYGAYGLFNIKKILKKN